MDEARARWVLGRTERGGGGGDGGAHAARACTEAFARARSLIRVEDQYPWSAEVATTCG